MIIYVYITYLKKSCFTAREENKTHIKYKQKQNSNCSPDILHSFKATAKISEK